ncbi:MAG: CBS domain-containing protein [Caldilineae bacterium]|nr:MAG: CBS domain-containing protein [Caldilineae bacterium]
MMSQQESTYLPPAARFSVGYVSYQMGVILDRVKLPPDMVMLLTALVVGLGTGVGAVAFRYLIRVVGWVGYDWFPQVTAGWGRAYVVLMPALGGLLVGLLVYLFAPEAKGHGVPEVMEAVALRGGRIRPVVALIKSLASSLCIGSGGSVGREGPIVQIGSALGSSVGQLLHLSDERVRNLVACGAAGGIAATFNAPIAGVIFALEIILGEFNVRYFSTVVISSVTASVIGRAVFGDFPAFRIPMEYGVNSLWEYVIYAVLGVLAALVGVLFVRLLYWSEDQFERWKQVPPWVQPAVGGMLLGGLALAYPVVTGVTWERMPQIYNVGYEVIEAALGNQLALTVVIVLLGLKLIATSLTLGSGGSGGIFAPSLFMGAMLGASYQLVISLLFPGIAAPPGAYALVGMGALFAASAHAPITAILILFELTGDYRIILPLMLTVVVATLIAQRMLHGESIYTLKLTRRGIRLQRGRDVDILEGVTVAEVMRHEVDTVSADLTLPELSEVFSRTRHHGLPVLDRRGKLWGIVTIADLDRAVMRNMPRRTTVSQIGTPRSKLVVAYPDETMGRVLTRMGRRGLGRLPVVSREDPDHLLGSIRRPDIIRAYNVALSRRAELQHRTRRMQLHNIDGTEFVDLVLQEGDRAVGKSVQEVAGEMPDECILISVRRDGVVVIPHGDTVFQPGDRVTAFIRSRDAEALHQCLRGA